MGADRSGRRQRRRRDADDGGEAGELLRLVPLHDVRADFRLREFADRAPQERLFLAGPEIHDSKNVSLSRTADRPSTMLGTVLRLSKGRGPQTENPCADCDVGCATFSAAKGAEGERRKAEGGKRQVIL